MRYIFILLVVLGAFGMVHAECEVPYSKFPGYAERFTGSMAQGGDYTFMEFNIKPKIVFSDAVTFEIYRYGIEYERFTLKPSEYHIARDEDVVVALNSISGNAANVTIYTRTIPIINASINVTPEVNYSALINASTPASRSGGLVYVDILLNNTGELPAQNITVEPLLQDFDVVLQPKGRITELCPGSTTELSFTLRAPLLWEITNYSIPMKVTYSYYDPQRNLAESATNLFTANLTVVGESRVAIYKRVRYPYDFEKMRTRDYALVGEKVTINVEIKNVGKVFDFIGSVREILPEGLEVIEGKTEWSGRISPGKSAYLSYTVTSKTPAEYRTYSLVEYTDEHGIVFSSNKSEEVVVKFLELKPEVVVEHKIEKTFKKRVALEMNASTALEVVVENKGTAPAYDISIKPKTDLLTDAKAVKIDLLKPGEKKTYTFEIVGNKQGKYEFKTDVSYRDEFHRTYTADTSTYIYVEAPLVVVQTETSLKDGRLSLNVKVKNAGSTDAENLLLRVVHPEDFKLISGQTVLPVGTLEPEESREYNLEFLVPIPDKEEKFRLKFDVEYTDRINSYRDTFLRYVTLKPPAGEFGVAVAGKNLYSLKEEGLVEVFIKNSRVKPERCTVSVDIPENFKLSSGYRLKDREIYLKPGESFRYKFGVMATAPGEGEIRVHVRYSQGEVIKSLRLRVKEPYLRVKTSEIRAKKGEEQVVEITIENTGYAEAKNGWLYFNPPEDIILDKTSISLPVFPPGGKTTLKIKITAEKSGEFEIPYRLKWKNSEEFEDSGNLKAVIEAPSVSQKTGKSEVEKSEKLTKEAKKTESAKKKENRSYTIIGLILLIAIIILVVLKIRRGAGVEF